MPSGAAGSVIFNAGIAFVADHFQEPERAQHIGTVLGAGIIGSLVGTPLISGTFALASEFTLPMRTSIAFAPALLLLLLAYVVLLRVKLPPKDQPLLAVEHELAKTDDTRGPLGRLVAVYYTVGSQAMLLVAMLVVIFGAEMALQTAIALDLKEHNQSSAIIGLTFMPSCVVSAIAAPLAGRLADNPKRRQSLLIGSFLLMAVGLVAVSVASDVLEPSWMITRAACVMVVAGLSLDFIDAPSISLMIELAEAKGIGNGQANTASELAVQMGSFVGPYLGAVAFEAWGFDALCWVIAGLCVLIGGIVCVWLEAGAGTQDSSIDAV